MATRRCHENGMLGHDARDSGLRSGLRSGLLAQVSGFARIWEKKKNDAGVILVLLVLYLFLGCWWNKNWAWFWNDKDGLEIGERMGCWSELVGKIELEMTQNMDY
ncbi:hypothetical protein KY285_016621 [Solanum tuberosum]|nr:hypothetical protein KY284_016629 [Solanum tuberosum]KAH0702343.1 hypothetical protein KY285_016621 [Solanum tuberosum]